MSQGTIADRALRVAVLTVSDTRTVETDKGGQRIQLLLDAHGQDCVAYEIVKDDFGDIRQQVLDWANRDDIDVIITTGGTGIAVRDVTLEAVESIGQKTIPGFGEIFRYLSFTEDIGTKAMASRATAVVSHGTLVFTIPGSVGAINLAMERLILPEMGHLVYEITK